MLLKSEILPSENERLLKIIEKYEVPQSTIKPINATKQNSIVGIETAIDIILILSNCNFPERKPPIKKNELKEVIAIVRFTDVDEATQDKL